MWLDNASEDAINLFWKLGGEIEPFPRSLERSVALALPVAIVKLPRLRLGDVEGWLQRRGTVFQFNCQSRAIRGCLIAYSGTGMIFIDGVDSDDERRFTLAHEIAHFVVDYWQPREKASAKLGNTIAEVMDGIRSPSVSERVHALLASTPIGVHTNLMERNEKSGTMNPNVWEIEGRADKIALALLAPPDVVVTEADISARRFEERQSSMMSLLCNRFGLPSSAASSYSRSLLISIGKGPSWAEAIRLR